MSLRMLAAVITAQFFATISVGQQFDRRSRDEPEVVIESGGRVGTADVLRFTPDGEFLLAAGDDKVVRVWPHSAAGLDTTPEQSRTLRWRGWRDQLGGIKAIAVSPDGQRVAVGGYGLKISSVAILSRETGATLAMTWPRTRVGSYHDAVTAIAFHPDGKRVGFGTADGTLWLWNPTPLSPSEGDRFWNAPACAGRFTNPNTNQLNFPRNIRFSDAETMVAVSHLGQVVACDLRIKLTDDPAAPVPSCQTHFDINADLKVKYPVHLAEWTGDGAWLVVATKGPLVLLRSADGKQTVRLDLPQDHFARSLAVHPITGTVALGIGVALPAVPGESRFYSEPNDQIWIYERLVASKPVRPKKLPHAGRVEAMTFHPTDNRLAIAGGDADEVTLLDLARPDHPVSVIRGAGRRLFAMSLSESGDVVAVKSARNPTATDPNDRGMGDWARFSLLRFAPTADVNAKLLTPINAMHGWEINPDATSRFVWHAEHVKQDGTRSRLRLGLDPDLDQAPTCFTFLPGIDGKPVRLLVGHYYGCSLFELMPENVVAHPLTGVMELPRSKLFIGHGAEVNSIVADKTGTWFVTAGADQTVAAWSLADWKEQPALGASFLVDNGQLVVRAVDVGSPAWEAGLSRGDQIELLARGGEVVYDRRAKRDAVGTPEQAIGILGKPQSGVELFFGWVTALGERRGTPTRLKQRPLWKWFPAFDPRGRLADSILWMWHGSYYFTASLHGDRYIGWHVNAPEVSGTPAFHPLEQYKHLFLRPDVITKLLETRSVAEALKEADGVNPVRRSFRTVEPTPIRLNLATTTVRPAGVGVTINVNPLGKNPDLLPERVELWINDYRFRAWAVKGLQSFAQELIIPATIFRAGENRVTAIAVNPLRGRAEATTTITNPATSPATSLWGFAVGINDYAGHRKASDGARAFGDLALARADATGFTKQLLTYRGPGKQFPTGDVRTLLDADAHRKAIITSLEELRNAAVKPDDVLVLFLAGHGDIRSPLGAEAPLAKSGVVPALPPESGRFYFCCPDYLPDRPRDTAVSGDELFEALAAVNCRKLVLLDTCHAGEVVEANILRRLIPNGQGPFVIASCDRGERSIEDVKLGHGVFTQAVIEAMGPKFRSADVNTDGILTPAELYDYLAVRVPELARAVRPGANQNPVCFPRQSQLPRVVLFRK